MFVQLFALMIVSTAFYNLQMHMNQKYTTDNYLDKTYEYSQRKIDCLYRWMNQL